MVEVDQTYENFHKWKAEQRLTHQVPVRRSSYAMPTARLRPSSAAVPIAAASTASPFVERLGSTGGPPSNRLELSQLLSLRTNPNASGPSTFPTPSPRAPPRASWLGYTPSAP